MRHLSLLFLGLTLLPAAWAGQPDTPYLEFIKTHAAALRADDAPPVSLEAWDKQRETLRAHLRHAWGGFPKTPCPLEPRVLDTLPRDGYRIEKIIFQTLPGLWMTANAYVPDRLGPLPTVLSVHGHWPGAKQDPNIQARSIGLAKLGFFVLAVDALGAGERGIGNALGEYHGDMVAATLWPIGRPLSGLQVYENGRAVDYLLTRPEVDGARIGITGASGGGNQSMYAGAWDERFKAIVPVCSVGNYQSYLGAACCMCEVVPGALSFTEEWAVLALTAPRALLVINATQDARQFSVGEAAKSLALATPVYALYGKPENVRHATFESGHDYSQPMRETMYGWMALHLQGEGDGAPIPEPAMVLEDPETLRCYPGDSRPGDWMTIPKFAAREGRALAKRLNAPTTLEAWHTMASGMRERLDRDVLWGTDPASSAPVPGSPFLPPISAGGTPSGTVLLLSLDTQAGAEEIALTSALTSAGRTVLKLQLRATGAYAQPGDAIGRAPDHNTAEWALWTGPPLLGQWVRDVRAALSAIEVEGGDLAGLTVVGIGPGGVVALCAAALDHRIQEVATVGALASYITDVPYEGQRLGIMAPGILREAGDIPHVAALIAPRRLIIAGGVSGDGQTLSGERLEAQYHFTQAVYEFESALGALSLLPSSADLLGALLAAPEAR